MPYLYASAVKIKKYSGLRLYKERLEKLGLRVLTLPDELFVARRYKNSVVDSHPNADGHRLIAQEISKQLISVLHEKQKGLFPSRN